MRNRLKKLVAVAVALAACLALIGFSVRGAPLTGSVGRKIEIGPQPSSQTIAFRGGERAAVSAFASNRDLRLKVRIAVYNAKGELVAEDKSDNDYAGVVWFPPRDGEYRIEVSHSDSITSPVYVVVK